MKVYNCLGLVLGYIPDLRRPSPKAMGGSNYYIEKVMK